MLLQCNKGISVKEFKSAFIIRDAIWNATTAWEKVTDTLFMDSITCGYPHYFDMTTFFLLQNLKAKTVVGEFQYGEGLSFPGIQSFDDTDKNCLSVDSDAPFSLQMTVKHVIWHECKFR